MESTGTLMSEKADVEIKQAMSKKLSAKTAGDGQTVEGPAAGTRKVGDAQERSAKSVQIARNAAATALEQVSRLRGVLTMSGTSCSEEFRDVHSTSSAGQKGKAEAAGMFFGIMTSLDRLSALLADQY